MSIKPTIIALILALIAVAAMAYTMQHDQHRVTVSRERRMLLSRDRLPVEQVTRITLKRVGEAARSGSGSGSGSGGADEMIFERNADGWNQVKPFAFPMDPFSIRQLMEQALQLELIERIDSKNLPANLPAASLQLQPPAAQVTYEWNGGNLTLNLGKTSMAGRAYLQIAGDPAILLVNQGLHERALQADPKEWRERAIFQDVGIESDRIERIDGGSRMVLVRQRKTWSMIEPVKTRLDPAARDAMLQELGRARVSGFILDQPTEADLAKFGLDKPVAMLTVNSDGGTAVAGPERGTGGTPMPPATSRAASESYTQRLLIGAAVSVTSQDRFGMVEGRPAVVKVPATVIGSLFRRAENLAAATACGTQEADVKSIVIRLKTDELRLERDLEKWSAPQLDRKEVPAAYVGELLNQLTALKAPDVVFAEYPRNLEIATITLYGFDGKAIDTVRIAQEKETGRYAMDNGDNVLRVFPAGMKMRMTVGDFGLK